MKKFYSYMILAVVTMFSFVACQTDDTTTPNAPVAEQMTFTAIAQSSETPVTEGTRAELNGRETWWNSDDKIYIYDGSAVNEFTIATENAFEGASQEAVFSGKAAQNDSYIAVFGQGNWTVEEGIISNVTIPAEQVAVEGSFDDNALVAAAYSTENTLAFTNLVALVKFTIGADNVSSVSFSATGGNLCGTGNITGLTEGTPAWEYVSGANNVTANTSFVNGSTYYVAVAPGTYETFSVTMGGTLLKTAEKVTLTAGKILNVGTLQTPSAWTLVGKHQNWDVANGTKMFAEGNYFVARNVKLTNVSDATDNGFKFVKGGAWGNDKGTHLAKTVKGALGTWYTAGGSNNIEYNDGYYDIYLKNDGTAYYMVKAKDPFYPITDWQIVGSATGTNWDTNTTGKMFLADMGSYYVAKNVTLTTSNEIKFRKGTTWTTQIQSHETSCTVNDVCFDYNGSNNIKVKTAGTYDIYVSKGQRFFMFVTAGTDLATFEASVKKFGFVGNDNWDNDRILTLKDGIFSYATEEFTATNKTFKIRYNKAWTYSWGSGNNVGANTKAAIYNNGGDSKNSKASTYTIYTDLASLYLMDNGTVPTFY